MRIHTRGVRKSVVLACMIVLINTTFFGAIAAFEGETNTKSLDKECYLSKVNNIVLDSLGNFNVNPFNEFPMGSRSNEILGTLIGPGSYSGSLSDYEVDFYTIPLNGSSLNTDQINITVETSSAGLGWASMVSPDLFALGGDMFTSTGTTYINRTAITTANHYLAIANPFTGTLNYYLNISTTQVTNNQNDGNNDFANATLASDGSSFQEGLNYTWDYWDEFSLTIPTEHNLTVTCEIVTSHIFDVTLDLYDAPNSSEEHLLATADEGWSDEGEILYYNSNVTQIEGYLHVSLWDVWGTSAYGQYWLNFSIREQNLKPKINLSDPNLNLWNSASGLSIDEDEVSDGDIILSEHFKDDGMPAPPGTLTYSFLSPNENISVVVHPNSSVSITPVANWFGNAVVNFFANDSELELYDDLNITVNSVNDIPVIETTDNWMFNNMNATYDDEMTILCEQGKYVDINVNASDIESDTLTFSIDSFNLSGIAATEDPFSISAQGNINFTPGNDQVGSFEFIINVTDGVDFTTHNFIFNINDVNDEPTITKVWVGTESVSVIDNSVHLTGTKAAIEDEEFNFTMEGMDIDIGSSLTFIKQSGPSDLVSAKVDDMKTNFSFMPTNDDALMSYVHVNVSVSDDSTPDDFVLINITVVGVNDAPTFTKIELDQPDASRYKNMGNLKVGAYSNFTIEAMDIDGDTLTLTANNLAVTSTKVSDEKWNISFHPAVYGNVTVNITLSDGTISDFYNFYWVVENVTPPKPPNRAPSISITTPSGQKFKLDEDVIIEGTWSDPDEDEILIQVLITFPDGNTYPIEILGILIFIDPPTSPEDTDFHYLKVNEDGTWKYTFQTSQYKEIYKTAELTGMQSLFGPKLTKGNYKFTFKATDDTLFGGFFGLTSTNASITIELTEKEEGNGGGGGELTMSMGLFDYDIILILIIIIVIILVVVMVMIMKKKRRAAEEMPPPPQEGMVPPPTEMNCPQCGAMIPAGSETCPGCGAPAPAPTPEAPPEGMPPEGMEAAPPTAATCATCGSEIPADSPTCVACGAPAPAPAVPPQEPPQGGMPPEQPQYGYEGYEGMPPEQQSYETMPPEQPQYEYEGMPPQQEQPPAEMPPPEQPPAPPPGMPTCPQCGGQLAVGTTPCPSCGAALNW